MKVLIVEDEAHAERRLASLLKAVDPKIEIVGSTDSVKQSVHWLATHPAPDLIFMDIQLGDGLSFSIFDQVKVLSPVIFTTAYDEYALRAFKVNSIDYLLKPVDQSELQKALVKYNSLTGKHNTQPLLDNLEKVLSQLTKKYKERFVVKVGEYLKTIEIKEVAFFYSQDKATFCTTFDNRNHILDYTLEQVQEMVDPSLFYRINRKYMVRSTAISDIIHYSNSRLRLVLKNSSDREVIVAREKVQEFKAWLDR